MTDAELKKLDYWHWQGDDGFNAAVKGAHLTLEEVKRWAVLTKNEDEEQIVKVEPSYCACGNIPKEVLNDWGEEKRNGYWEIPADSRYKRKIKVTKYYVDYKIPVTKNYL